MNMPSATVNCQGTSLAGQSVLGVVIRTELVDPRGEFAIRLGCRFDADAHMLYDYKEPQHISKAPDPP
jgi:hypothetical protein